MTFNHSEETLLTLEYNFVNYIKYTKLKLNIQRNHTQDFTNTEGMNCLGKQAKDKV